MRSSRGAHASRARAICAVSSGAQRHRFRRILQRLQARRRLRTVLVFMPLRASALECAAVIDVLVLLGAMPASDAEQGKLLVSRIVAMLSKLCR
jgi:hypothetical protein